MKDKHYHYLINYKIDGYSGGAIFCIIKNKKITEKDIVRIQNDICFNENIKLGNVGIYGFYELECDCDD